MRHAPPHHLGSYEWHDKNWPIEVGLGELPKSSQITQGELPAVVPLPVIPDANCLAVGEVASNAIDPTTLIDGFPPACFIQDPAIFAWPEASAYDRCGTQKFYARIIDWLYWNNVPLIKKAFFDLLGPTAVVTVHPGAGLFTSVCTVIHPTFAILVSDGTANFEQLAVQFVLGILPPQNFGGFRTFALWNSMADLALHYLQIDGYAPGNPIFFSGHSYGGAVVLLCAARLRMARPTLDIKALTFGTPKPGDAILRRKLSTIPQMNLANEEDPVPVLPPDFLTLLTFEPFISASQVAILNEWERPPNQVFQDAAGGLSATTAVPPDIATILAFLGYALGLNGWPDHFAHPIKVYLDRIILRCPSAGWPIRPPLDVVLNDPPAIQFTGKGGAKIGGSVRLHFSFSYVGSGGAKIGGTAFAEEHGTATFDDDTNFLASTLVTRIFVEAWGAGGNSSYEDPVLGDTFSEGGGGGGQFQDGFVFVTGDHTYPVVVGLDILAWVGPNINSSFTGDALSIVALTGGNARDRTTGGIGGGQTPPLPAPVSSGGNGGNGVYIAFFNSAGGGGGGSAIGLIPGGNGTDGVLGTAGVGGSGSGNGGDGQLNDAGPVAGTAPGGGLGGGGAPNQTPFPHARGRVRLTW